MKALVQERRAEPWAVEFGDIHTDFEFIDRDLLFMHALPCPMEKLGLPPQSRLS